MTTTGTFSTTIQIENHLTRGQFVTVTDALVDPDGAMMTWVPEEILRSIGITVEGTKCFVAAECEQIERDVGYAFVQVAGAQTFDEIVFAKPGDRTRLGWRSLGGLNLKVDPGAKKLIPGGPVLAAAAA